MRWRFRHEPDPGEVEAMRDAELKLSIARQMQVHAAESARVHTGFLQRNNLGPKFRRALGGPS